MRNTSSLFLVCICFNVDDFSHSLEKPHDEITITLPDGAVKTGKRWETTPMMIAEGISKGLAQKVVCARVCLFIVLVMV